VLSEEDMLECCHWNKSRLFNCKTRKDSKTCRLCNNRPAEVPGGTTRLYYSNRILYTCLIPLGVGTHLLTRTHQVSSVLLEGAGICTYTTRSHACNILYLGQSPLSYHPIYPCAPLTAVLLLLCPTNAIFSEIG